MSQHEAEHPPGGGSSLADLGPTTRRESVALEIKRGIVRGRLTPGQKLTEAALSEALGVSRATIREAINLLCQEGLLVQEPYRGLRVASLDARAVIDIAEARVGLDLQAVRSILKDQTGERLEAVAAAWRAFEAVALDADPMVQHEAHVEFHHRLWLAADNYLLSRLWPVTEAHTTIALAYDRTARDDPQRAHAVHARIVQAVQSRDLRRIRAALEAHTLDSAYELVELMGEA